MEIVPSIVCAIQLKSIVPSNRLSEFWGVVWKHRKLFWETPDCCENEDFCGFLTFQPPFLHKIVSLISVECHNRLMAQSPLKFEDNRLMACTITISLSSKKMLAFFKNYQRCVWKTSPEGRYTFERMLASAQISSFGAPFLSIQPN